MNGTPLRFERRVLVIVGPYGFCFGVRRTVEKIIELVNDGRKIFTDGPVVHNKNVVGQLERLGLRVLKSLEELDLSVGILQTPEQKIGERTTGNSEKQVFVIRAHGLPPNRIEAVEKLRQRGIELEIVDLTCPIVKSNIELARKLVADGYTVVVFGEESHPEMVALIGHIPNAIVTKKPNTLQARRIAVMSQTTSSSIDFEGFVTELKSLNGNSEILVFDTICNVTKERERAARWLSENSALVIVVGGKNSANTKKLHEIASKNTVAIHVEDSEELNMILPDISKLAEQKHSGPLILGVISGTSTTSDDVSTILKILREKLGGREHSMAEFQKNAYLPEQLAAQPDNNGQEEHYESFEELLNSTEGSERTVRRGAIVEATVLEIAQTGLTVDLGGKLTGILPLEEAFKEISEYKAGERIKVRIERINEEEGTALVSEKKPMERVVREKIEKAFSESKTVSGRIIERTKGGYRVVLENVVDAFLPGSEAGLRPEDELPREKLEFAILTLEHRGRKLNVVVSRRKVLEKSISDFFVNHKPGDVVEGIVESIDDRGASIRIGNLISAYLPNKEVSYNPTVTAKDILSVGKSGKFVIREIDPAKRRVLLSIKALLPDPWEKIEKRYVVGQTVTGKVTSIKPFGFFVQLEEGIEGLVPLSEVFWERRGKIEDIITVGELVKAQVIDIKPEKRQITLSYRNALGDPWEGIEEKYPVGNIVTGKVARVLANGAVIELERDLTAFCAISELSWNFVENPEEIVHEGDKVRVRILEVDRENKKIRVSIKKATENPWEVFAKNHKEGDIVTAKIIKRVDKGYIGMCENVEVYIPATQIYGELNKDDEISGKIIKLEQLRDIYKIIVSPKAYENEQALKEAKSGGVSAEVKIQISEPANAESETKHSEDKGEDGEE